MTKLCKVLCLSPVLWYFSVLHSGAQVARPTPGAEMYTPVLQWLASPDLEGRETGTRGSALAAGFIASEMQQSRLSPLKKANGTGRVLLSDYFQPFSLFRFTPVNGELHIPSGQKRNRIQLIQGKDFTTEYAFQNIKLTAPVVFAGYGIRTAIPRYNNYQALDAKGKVVVILEGYPEVADTTTPYGAELRKLFVRDGFDLSARSHEAYEQGAVALLVIPEEFITSVSAGKEVENYPEPLYQDAFFLLSADTLPRQVPLIRFTPPGALVFTNALHLRVQEAVLSSIDGQTFPVHVRSDIHLNIHEKTDTLVCNNVIGNLTGRDTSQTIVIGAHYDHLGQRDGNIYCGADDNASGVAGLLSLASSWGSYPEMPACNIVFAGWTAEEKGLLGSSYFVSSLPDPEKVKLYINMDMISRSERADSLCRMLSAGTRTCDAYLRTQAEKCNALLDVPFNLDLWDVTGHHGSDYASFTARGIPVLTLNTGLHDDYHTPRDVSGAVDYDKMGRVIRLVNLLLSSEEAGIQR